MTDTNTTVTVLDKYNQKTQPIEPKKGSDN